MKKITIVLLSCALGAMSCKKEEEAAPVTPPAPVTFGTVEVTIINDTVDFSTTTSCFEWSVGMGLDSVSSDYFSLPVYAIKSTDSCGFFSDKKALEFAAFNGNKLFLNDNLGGSVKKYVQGQTVDYNAVINSGSAPQGNVSALILKEGTTTPFNINETFYLGTAFLKNGNYYNGWVKVKTLNNYYSCIIVSYGVCKTANTPVKAE